MRSLQGNLRQRLLLTIQKSHWVNKIFYNTWSLQENLVHSAANHYMHTIEAIQCEEANGYQGKLISIPDNRDLGLTEFE